MRLTLAELDTSSLKKQQRPNALQGDGPKTSSPNQSAKRPQVHGRSTEAEAYLSLNPGLQTTWQGGLVHLDVGANPEARIPETYTLKPPAPQVGYFLTTNLASQKTLTPAHRARFNVTMCLFL